MFCHRMSENPSPLKSPVPTAYQLTPGLPRLPPPIRLVPFISQMATSPVAFCHRTSARLSPLKSPVPIVCQLGPGLPRLPPPITLVPFNSQIAISPLLLCHRKSDLPSALKSLLLVRSVAKSPVLSTAPFGLAEFTFRWL